MITKEKGILIKSVSWDLRKTWLTDQNANWPMDGQTDRQTDRLTKGQANGPLVDTHGLNDFGR